MALSAMHRCGHRSLSSGSAWSRVSLARAEALSVTVLDRNDRLLRAYTASDGRWRLPVEVKDVDPRYLAMLLAFEDRRFRSHHGVDPVAIGRAGWQLLRPSPHRLGRLDAHDAGGAPARRRARAHGCRQGAPGAARAAARAQALQGRDPAPLPPPRAVRRQPGGRARGLARLLRQGAAPSVVGGGSPAGRPAAVAGAAPARPLPAGRAARPRPRSGARRCPGHHSRRRGAARQGRAHAERAPRVPHAGPAPGGHRGRAGQEPPRASPHDRCRRPGQPRAARRASTRRRSEGACRRP